MKVVLIKRAIQKRISGPLKKDKGEKQEKASTILSQEEIMKQNSSGMEKLSLHLPPVQRLGRT